MCCGFASVAGAAESGALRAGAAKIDITPAADAGLPMAGFGNRVGNAAGVHDSLNVRAIVVDDGSAQAAIVTVELIGLSNALWEKMTARLKQETGIAAENVLLTAVHTHSAPALGGPLAGTGAGDLARKRAEYGQRVEDSIVNVVKQAQAALQPAKIGYGTGRANVSINRRARTADGGWGLGYNPDGPSDKTVAVVKLETMAGEPFAIFSNYGVHATVMGASNNQISSDLPGATARFVEEHYKNKVVSPWASGAGGDQAPIYDRNGTGFQHVAVLGRILGEEVVRVAETIKTSARAKFA
jgi:neutral ceramidase